jgi:putative hydrolase of the HAD superfamily
VSTRAILFDLDNTLILEDQSTYRALGEAALAGAKAGIDAAALATAAGRAADRFWRAAPEYVFADAFGIWWGEALWGDFAGETKPLRALRAFTPEFRLAVWTSALTTVGVSNAALAGELAERYRVARRMAETIDPEAEPLLRALASRYPLALVTNGAGDVQREKLARTPFARYFAEVVISVEVGVGKPDPELFRIAARRLGREPADAVVVGDSLARDIAGAKAAGMQAIWIDRKLSDEREGVTPDATVERLSDLPAALDELAQRSASHGATP